MKIYLDSNPSDAPGCLKIVSADGRDILIQTDWDWPGVASSFGWNSKEVQCDNLTANFNRFSLDLPKDCIDDCSHQGECDEDIKYWAKHIERPAEITPEALSAELKEYGAWDANELADDAANWRRLIWIVAGNIKDNKCEHKSTDGTIDCPDCGLSAHAMIQASREWLDDNDGAEAEDPGYFEE